MESKHQEEIDLLMLLAKFFKYLSENRILVVLIPLLGVLLGFIFFTQSSEKFESKMMLRSEILSATECNFLLEQFERTTLIPEISAEQRNGLLKLSHSMISLDPIVNPKREAYAEITIRVKSRELLIVFQKTILDFMENSEPAQSKKLELKNFYTTMIAKIDRELALLEEVKANTNDQAKISSQRPSDLFTTAVDLTDTKTRYEQQMKEDHAIIVVQGFDRVVSEIKLSLFFAIMGGLFFGVIVLVAVLFLKFFFGYYARYKKIQSN